MSRSLRTAAAIVLALVGLGAVPPPAITLSGVVADRERLVPVVDATVTLVRAGRSVATDEVGVFTFGASEITGAEQLVITHPDYRTVRLPVGTLPDGQWSLEITLVREALGLEDGAPARGTGR